MIAIFLNGRADIWEKETVEAYTVAEAAMKTMFPRTYIFNPCTFLNKYKGGDRTRKREKILIIDTKYYEKTMQMQYDKPSMHSKNLYQIFTYVKNQDAKGTGNVSGMLLYAKTDEEITPDCSFVVGGNRISVKTLDLNREFAEIAAQLDQIARDHFGEEI
jgi:hypothetical protein